MPLFGGRRQRTTGLKLTIGNQACPCTTAAYAAQAWLAAPSVTLRTTCPRTPRRLRLSADPRCTAPARLPLSAGSDFDGEEVLSTPTLDSVCVPLRFTQRRTPGRGTTDVHYCRACQFQPSVMRRLRASRTGLMSPQELASRASNYRPVRAARNPRTTIGPFAASATTGSATRACIPETLLLPAPPQDAERPAQRPAQQRREAPLLNGPLDGVVRRRSIRTHRVVGLDSCAGRRAPPECVRTRDSRGSTECAAGLPGGPRAPGCGERAYRLQVGHTIEPESPPDHDGPRPERIGGYPPTILQPPRSEQRPAERP